VTERFYPLATTTWDDAERSALLRVIDSGHYTMGPLVAQCERDFAASQGAGFGVMVNSGSSANLLAVAAVVLDERWDLKAGDEVLVPAVSWATTYYPLTQYGLILKFVDIDLDTLNMDLDKAREAIGPKTRGIMSVNLLGNPMDYTGLGALASEHNLVVLEDNCESLGSNFEGIAGGTFGLMGTYSSFFSHHIATMEGGFILTDDEALCQTLISLRAHGWTRELPDKNFVYDKSGDRFDDLFRFVLPGYNVRPIEMEGALGIEQVKKLPALIAGRRANAVLFAERFRDVTDVRIQSETGESSWFGFSLILEGRLAGRRTEVVAALDAAGIDCRPIVAGNFARNPVMKHLPSVLPSSLPAADRVHVDGLFVGNHHYPIPDQIDRLAETVSALS
jgi:CDP-6-deoxy-D-xylo-4-hexulose-3-dehydrase